MSTDRASIVSDFRAVLNMDADELEEWLSTPESRSVGQKKDGAESIGHASGRRILEILRKDRPTESDYAHMRKVVGFIRRHRAQEPENIVTSRWRYSLMNWGYDRLKD